MKNNIQMVDLKTQYHFIKEEIDKAVIDCISSTAFINGPAVKEFQVSLELHLGVKHVIPCANGTDSLQIAMMALDLQPGDEVICPAFTYVATAEVIGLLGLIPVMVDVDSNTFNLTALNIEKAITSKTKAIVPVHLYGQSCDMEPIMQLAEKHNLFVIEDNAQAIGADYTFSDGRTAKTGTIGHIGSTSFFPSKNLGCYGDGGAVFTNDSDLAERMKMVANHGQRKKYVHEIVGCNSRLDTLQAAILLVKLQHLNDYCDARRKVADFYDAAFADHSMIITPFRAPYSHHVFHQYTIMLEGVDRDTVKARLEEKGIPSMIYYPIPLHLQKAYRDDRYLPGSFPITEELCANVLTLPIHTEFDETELAFITTKIIEYLR
jgi:dTDP-4-amino-4,6-dideoxygalactose transaminase